MTPDEKQAFVAALSRTFRTVTKPLPDAEVIGVWWELLKPFPLVQVASAFAKYLSVKDVSLTPAAVLRYLPKRRDDRPEVDEAWAIAVRAADESETVVWTTEIAGAWVTAQPVFQLGDVVGARMAFKAAYGRLVDQACATGYSPKWIVSQGFDAERRLEVVSAAIRDGRLRLDQVQAAGSLLTGPDNRMPLNARAREQLKQLKLFCRQAVGAGVRAAAEKSQKAQAQREQLKTKKFALAEQVQRYRRRQHGGKS